MALQTEYEFSLPKGYVDEEGTLHKKGVLRLATAADEILPQKDPRVQSNPAYLILILLSRVVTKLGSVTDVNPSIIEGLFLEDLTYLKKLYQRINGNGELIINTLDSHWGECVDVNPLPSVKMDVQVNGNFLFFQDKKEGKYHPLPDPSKEPIPDDPGEEPLPDPDSFMLIYDTKTKYLKAEAEKLSVRLKEKGILVTLKSVLDYTDEDKENYEIILLRAREMDSGKLTNMDISSHVEWSESEGEVEIVNDADSQNRAPIFMIGGKNKAAVERAVEEYVGRYSAPQ